MWDNLKFYPGISLERLKTTTDIIVHLRPLDCDLNLRHPEYKADVQSGSNMTGTDLYVNKPHCGAAVRP